MQKADQKAYEVSDPLLKGQQSPFARETSEMFCSPAF